MECESLDEMKQHVDRMLRYLVGKEVVCDAFHLGICRKIPSNTSNPASLSASSNLKPRPLLICIANFGDIQLILSKKQSLKYYNVPRVFIREDLPLNLVSSN